MDGHDLNSHDAHAADRDHPVRASDRAGAHGSDPHGSPTIEELLGQFDAQDDFHAAPEPGWLVSSPFTDDTHPTGGA